LAVLGQQKPPSRVATNGQLQRKHLKNTPTGSVARLPWLILRKLALQRWRSGSASVIPRMSSGIAEASGAEIGSRPDRDKPHLNFIAKLLIRNSRNNDRLERESQSYINEEN
jgi:hypothetical protein